MRGVLHSRCELRPPSTSHQDNMPDSHSRITVARHGRVKLTLVATASMALIVAAVGLYGLRRHAANQPSQGLAEARQALADDDFAEAQRLAGQVLARDAQSVPALLVAAETAARDGRWEDAVDFWDRIPDGCGTSGAAGLLEAGNVLLDKLDRATAAERRFRRAIENDPQLVSARHRLANLLAVEGRTSEAVPVILDLLGRGRVDIDQLTLLGMPQGTINDADLLRRCHVADREDPAILLGLAASVTFNLPSEQARLLLSEAVRLDPTLIDAQVRLGTLLLEADAADDFLAWHNRLPKDADRHAEIWALRGAWAQDRGEPAVARRCYWEALRRDPNHRAALYQLGQLLMRAGQPLAAVPLVERGNQLQRLQQLQDVLFQSDHEGLEPMRAVAEQLVALGRLWEARGWCDIALQMKSDAAWALALRSQLTAKLDSQSPLTLAESNPVAHLDFSGDPRPHWTLDATPREPTPELASSAIAFAEDAAEVKLDFRYFNNSHSVAAGKRMYEFPGGGVAILDFDLDGWPDIYFTQGAPWPLDVTQRTHLDQLSRNVDGQFFREVTADAATLDSDFSHGVTVGDFDNDGFPDLYVANIGRNRLFQNNGDGTFSDVSANVTGDAERWTTSCLLADVNGDGLPDLYDVNYVTAADVFERVCQHADGTPRMCMPFHFPAAQDQLYLNQGDGRFVDGTATSGIDVGDGRGLGIVAADFDGSGRLSLFIANDTTPNFFFANQGGVGARASTGLPAAGPPAAISHSARDGNPPAGEPLFTECAVSLGLAFNAHGRSEGCMGIAAGDINRDGRIDLFVGNFLKETNTLYLQEEGGSFADNTREFALAQPSLEQLAFGAQFIDAELDGDLDLIVANGHVDDVRAYGRPYHMRPQFFENPGAGSMIERNSTTLGMYFDGRYLGRSLAKCDWNRDGLEDVVVSHLDSPAALLTNRSKPAGHVLVVRLIGVESSRDAIGTIATLQFGATSGPGAQTLVRQVTAGDGYQCSNQRLLVFGVGAADSLDALQIKWPSGRTTTYRDLPTDAEILCVEGHDNSVKIRELRFFAP